MPLFALTNGYFLPEVTRAHTFTMCPEHALELRSMFPLSDMSMAPPAASAASAASYCCIFESRESSVQTRSVELEVEKNTLFGSNSGHRTQREAKLNLLCTGKRKRKNRGKMSANYFGNHLHVTWSPPELKKNEPKPKIHFLPIQRPPTVTFSITHGSTHTGHTMAVTFISRASMAGKSNTQAAII